MKYIDLYHITIAMCENRHMCRVLHLGEPIARCRRSAVPINLAARGMLGSSNYSSQLLLLCSIFSDRLENNTPGTTIIITPETIRNIPVCRRTYLNEMSKSGNLVPFNI